MTTKSKKIAQIVFEVIFVLINGVLPFFFFSHWEAQIVLACFFVGSGITFVLQKRFSDQRIVSAGKVFMSVALLSIFHESILVELPETMLAWLGVCLVINTFSVCLGFRDLISLIRTRPQ